MRSGGTHATPEPPVRAVLRSTSSSIATATASVATASVMPRTRTAGRPVTMPTARLAATPASSASAGGHPADDSRAIVNPATPANANGASEICPTYPVRTTTDRASTALVMLTIRPSRPALPSVEQPDERQAAEPRGPHHRVAGERRRWQPALDQFAARVGGRSPPPPRTAG